MTTYSIKSNTKTTTVAGQQYKVWSDYIMRATYAEDESGKIKRISGNGYISNDLTVRKAIAIAFRLSTFRK